MRLHHDNPASFIQGLALSIDKDPASMENWRCLYIEHKEEVPFERYEHLLAKLKEAHPEADCDVIQCMGNAVLFISRDLAPLQLGALAEELIKADERLQMKPDIHIYDLFADWREVRQILHRQASNAPAPQLPASGYHFGDIASLGEVFDEAKKLRRTRLPLHVMIVEDDALTRRIVSGTFKENYAIIAAANAQEAVANYLMHAPDIVFLDIGLPDTSGFDVLRQIMALDPQAYVVMFSANSYLENVTAALCAGASGFIAKPFRKEKMRHYIEDSAIHHCKSSA